MQAEDFVYEYTYDAAGNRTRREYIDLDLGKIGSDQEPPKPQTETIAEHEITIFPNPAKSHITLEITNLAGKEEASVTITDMSGREVMTLENLKSENMIDLSKQTNGVYFMKIAIADKDILWKIIKED